jgi:benzylsuccinate CoA-transferase BbsF subunit
VQDAHDLSSDEQLLARDWFTEVENPVLGRRSVDRFPARFEATPLGEYNPPPAFGQHTFDVYQELLRLSDEQIAQAIADGLFT